MKTSFFEQAARAIKSRSNRTRWLSVTLCLALVVSTGTFYAFMRPGQAKVRTEKLLVCQYVPHEHDDSCYGVDEDGNIDESVILCGYADYVLHSHTDDCYDENGRLVCELPELEAHQHDSNCYSYHEYLVCDHVPAETGHQHTDECYEERVIEDGGETGTETTEGACTQEEHVHTSDCYTKTETTGERVLTCGMHEHTHDDSCYTEKTEDVLTCTAAEHVHGDGCYSPTYSNELTCNDSSEEHTHDSGCYSQVQTGTELTCGQTEHSHDGGCYTTETTRELTCGEKEHTHDDSCYSEGEGEVVEELTCGKMEHTHDENCGGSSATSSGPKTERVLICDQEETVPEDVHTSDCYETEKELICDKEELEVHIHDDSCYDEDDNLICGKLEVQEHVHGPECFIEVTVGVDDPKYTCGKTYHVHEDGCYSEDGTLLCPLEEHEHSDSCLSAVQERWICGMTAHKHDESCYNDAMELICGLEEHEHSDSCLPEPEWLCGKMEHTHDDSCYDANGELVCPLEEHQHTGLCMNPALQPEPEWKCGKIAHTHDDSCYDENGVLICELKEHEHTNLCLKSEDEVSWLCGKTAHTHDESCYDEDGVLVCGLEEHEHTYDCLKDHAIEWLCGRTEHKHGENCYDENGVLVCGLEEHTHTAFCLMEEIRDEDCICGKIAHIHDESCYDENGELICGLEEHIHTAECLPEEIKWLCGKTEHHHDESCYDENGVLICGLEEHTHTAACLVEQDGRWLCGKIEHTHGPDCYDENGELICDLEEHTHTDECLLLPLTIPVTQENQYTTNSGLFDVTFRVEGPAILRRDPGEMPEEPAESSVPVESADASPDDVTAAPADDLPAPDAEDAAPTETTPADVSDAPAESNYDFRFQIDELTEVMDANAEARDAYLLFTEKAEEQEQELLEAMSMYLYCDGEKLDLSDCKVTAEIKPTELLKQMVAEMEANAALAIEDSEASPESAEAPQEAPSVALRLTAVEAVGTVADETTEAPAVAEVKELDTIYITADDAASVPDASATSDDADSAPDTSETETDAVDTGDNADTNEGKQNQGPVTDEPESVELKTMMVTMSSSNVAVVGARDTEPKFTVQYYAELDRLVMETNGILNYKDADITNTLKKDVIDTSAAGNNGTAATPTNTTNLNKKQIFVRKTAKEDEGIGTIVHKKDVVTKLFTERPFLCSQVDPNFSYYDILPANSDNLEHYKLKEVWVGKPTCAPQEPLSHVHDRTCAEWKVIGADAFTTTHFTNSQEVADKSDGTYIALTDGTVVCMTYEPIVNSDYTNDAAFYDYDISDGYIYDENGQNGKEVTQKGDESQAKLEATRGASYAKTNHTRGDNPTGYGINDVSNYSGKGSKLAFGNANAGTGMDLIKNGSNYINSRNRVKGTSNDIALAGCSFGIVTNLRNDGTIQYASGIDAPNLFNDGDAVGKIGYGGDLRFKRNGDTYTLAAVEGDYVGATNLDRLYKIGYGDKITTNEFWPFDKAPSYGEKTITKTVENGVQVEHTQLHDLRFGSFEMRNMRKAYGYGNFPNSDFPNAPGTTSATGNQDHNSYFGLNFAVDFTLTKDYLGPLEYVFFGDDDLWVFLTDNSGKDTTLNGKLICDVGGLHSTVGEYVDLRDYIKNENWGENEESRSYTLTFFYTERGASGSTCWMQFTLPQVSSKTVPIGGTKFKNTVKVGKNVSGSTMSEEELAQQEFNFKITITEPGDIRNEYFFTRYTKDGTAYTDPQNSKIKITSKETKEFKLKHGEYILIDHLPEGTTYKIEECDMPPGYQLDSPTDTVEGTIVNGSISGDKVSSAIIPVTLINRTQPQMPETGGTGTTTFSVIGAGLLLGGMLIVLRRKREE